MSLTQSFLRAAAAASFFFGLSTPVVMAQVHSARGVALGPTYPIYGDVNADCVVNNADLLEVLAAFGTSNGRADLNDDGTVDQLDVDLVTAWWGSTCGKRLTGDINGDGVVSNTDLLMLLAAWGTNDATADLNCDGTVDDGDLDLLQAYWGATLGRRLLGDVNGDNVVDNRDLLIVLAKFGTQDPNADINGDGSVGQSDVDAVTAQWNCRTTDRLTGDVTGDCVVDARDQEVVLGYWGQSTAFVDVDGDGIVGNSDLLLVLGNWGTICADRLAGDVNGDCVVDARDQASVLGWWGSTHAPADLDANGTVGNSDLLIVLANFGAICGTDPTGDVNGDCTVGAKDSDLVMAFWGTSYAPADIDGDGTVGNSDLLAVLGNWDGTCGK